MINYSQKAGTIQSFGWIFTEVTMLLSLLYCVESLKYALVYIAIIPAALLPSSVVLALFHSGALFTLTIVFVIFTTVVEVVYGIILAATLSSHETEIRLADELFSFYLLLGGLIVHIILLIWITIIMFKLSKVRPAVRLAVPQTSNTSISRTGNTLIALMYAYAVVLLASSFLNFVDALAWTSFYVVLFLPYGIPFLMTMMLFKQKQSVDVGTGMMIFVSLIDAVYTLWLLLSYNIQRDTMAAMSFGIAGFWLLFSSFILRILISSFFSYLMQTIRSVPFEKRFYDNFHSKQT